MHWCLLLHHNNTYLPPHNADITRKNKYRKMNIFQTDLKSGQPIYKQLAEHIITLIRNKQIAVGYKLPTVNRAYDMAHVSRDTIINTYKYL